MSSVGVDPFAAATQHPSGAGAVIVFEGPDGVGKTSIVTEVNRALSGRSERPIVQLSFPGREPGTLGHHVYQLHHCPAQFGVSKMAPASLQLLHIAAHLDTIDQTIRPHVEQGAVVLLDRYWWSTWVYGITGGVDRRTLRTLIKLERLHWGSLTPVALFLVRRRSSLRPEEDAVLFDRRRALYDSLSAAEATKTRIVTIDNDGELCESSAKVLRVVREIVLDLERV